MCQEQEGGEGDSIWMPCPPPPQINIKIFKSISKRSLRDTAFFKTILDHYLADYNSYMLLKFYSNRKIKTSYTREYQPTR